ncbi:hypothetical protein M413DRAFT_112972 [Hebeloma cylindrosporum]|uniref:Uncharacterized protein n=1 Tax=Hebeloma cylindrosporum TaxID=76867 RepID=A0A0C3CZQ7_HEBCY|nr:hypothetical protein M413DRAFT_112972 [Hebeloma cylindrosporum h7]
MPTCSSSELSTADIAIFTSLSLIRPFEGRIFQMRHERHCTGCIRRMYSELERLEGEAGESYICNLYVPRHRRQLARGQPDHPGQATCEACAFLRVQRIGLP